MAVQLKPEEDISLISPDSRGAKALAEQWWEAEAVRQCDLGLEWMQKEKKPFCNGCYRDDLRLASREYVYKMSQGMNALPPVVRNWEDYAKLELFECLGEEVRHERGNSRNFTKVVMYECKRPNAYRHRIRICFDYRENIDPDGMKKEKDSRSSKLI